MVKKPQKSLPARIDSMMLFRVLMHIANHAGVASPELEELTGLSRATVARLIVNARQQFGVVITWRRDYALPTNGEYTIEDWGVFSPSKVNQFMRGQ
jgi:hypothetical protein